MSKASEELSRSGLFSGGGLKISYDKNDDRLKLFLPQQVTSRKRDNPSGVTAFGVYVEIPRPGPQEEKPFFHLALAPRTTVKNLEERLRLHKFEAAEWPVTYTPESWHDGLMKKAWSKQQSTPEPSLVVPSLTPGPVKLKPASKFNPVFDLLEEKGFVTSVTAEAIAIALEAFTQSKPGEFKTRVLEQKLNKLYSPQRTL